MLNLVKGEHVAAGARSSQTQVYGVERGRGAIVHIRYRVERIVGGKWGLSACIEEVLMEDMLNGTKLVIWVGLAGLDSIPNRGWWSILQ